MSRSLPRRAGAPVALVASLSLVAPGVARGQSAATPVPGTYLCWSSRLTELLAQDAAQAQRAAGPTVVPDRILAQLTSGGQPLRYLIRPNGTYADVTYGDRYAADARYNGRYTVAGGVVRLVTAPGTPLFVFRRARSAQGEELLVQVREGPRDPYASTQVCRRTDATAGVPASPPRVAAAPPLAATAPVAPAPEPARAPTPTVEGATDAPPTPAPVAAVPTVLRGHPNRPSAYPGHVLLDWTDYARTPERASVELALTPIDGGAPITVRRTVTALRTPTAFDDSRSLDSTSYVPLLAPGAYRVRAVLLLPDGTRRPLDLRVGTTTPQAPELELRWTEGQRYQDGGGKILTLIADPPADRARFP